MLLLIWQLLFHLLSANFTLKVAFEAKLLTNPGKLFLAKGMEKSVIIF